MARKRLSPARAEFLGGGGTEPLDGAARGAPIAQLAGDSAANHALQQLTDEVAELRRQGRLVMEIPRSGIAPDHLARDRVALDPEELRNLARSIFTHGQRSPVEVTELAGDSAHGYGLISGWRRLSALKYLREETGDPRFDTVLAVIRTPRDSADAYVSMVEENEIRVGLSYYERARVAAEAVKRGVFETEKQALLTLFENASRAKRSRIRSFLTLYHAFDGVLRFPAAIPERLGLALVEAMREDQGVAPRLRATLERDPAPDAEAELAVLRAALAPPPPDRRPEPPELPDVPRAEHLREELPNGLVLELRGRVLKIRGPQVDAELLHRLRDVLQNA